MGNYAGLDTRQTTRVCGTLTYIELATHWPEAGSSYVFVRNIYGPATGFVVGLSVAIISCMGSLAIVGMAFGAYFQKLGTGIPPETAANTAVMIATLIHCLGVREGNAVNQIGAIFKIALLSGLVVWGFSVEATADTLPPNTGEDAIVFSPSTFGYAMAAVAFAYLGWDNPTYIAGEIRDSRRSLKWGMSLGMIAVTILYLLVNSIFLRAAAPHEIIQSDGSPVVDIGQFSALRLFGETAGSTFNVLIGIVLFSTLCLNAMIGARVFYSMGRKRELPRDLSILNSRGSPYIALGVQCIGAMLLIQFTVLKDLLESVDVILTVISSVTVFGVILLRIRQPDLKRPYRVPFYPLPPLIYLMLTFWMAWSVFRSNPISIILILGTIGIALAIWLGYTSKKSHHPSKGNTSI